MGSTSFVTLRMAAVPSVLLIFAVAVIARMIKTLLKKKISKVL